jgi:hypothetical protein
VDPSRANDVGYQMNEQLRDELLMMMKRDLDTRERLVSGRRLWDGYAEEMEKVHSENAERLRAIIDEFGWPGRSLAGADGANAAWLIAQHSISRPTLQRRFLKALNAAVAGGEVPPLQAAYLEDRIRFHEGRPQRYGLVFDWDEQGELNTKVDDVAKANARRKRLGLPPLAEALREQRRIIREEGAAPPDDLKEYRRREAEWAERVGWRVRRK